MKKLVFTVSLACASLIAQPPAGRRGPMEFGPGLMGRGAELRHTVAGAPYSGVEVTVEQQALANGNVIQRQVTRNTYRDAQGRVRIESEFTRPATATAQATTVKRITISDPVGGYLHEVNPQNKTVISRAVRPAGAQAGANSGGPRRNANGSNRPTNPNVQTESLGTQTINGVAATGERITRTIPAGTIGNAQPIQTVRETWMSADLKVPVMVKTSDPRFGTRVMQLTQINRAEPDAALFQVPAGYTVKSARFGGRGGGAQQ